jgi:hypothetical protein
VPTSRLAQLRKVSQVEALRLGNGRNDPMAQSLALILENEVIARRLSTCLDRSRIDINRSNPARVGDRLMDALQNLSVVDQNFAQGTRRIEIYAISALIAAVIAPVFGGR